MPSPKAISLDEALAAVAPKPSLDDALASVAPVGEESAGDSGAIVMRGAASALPAIARGTAKFATNPNVPRIGATIGRVVGAMAPAVVGGVEGGPVGALAGVAAASEGAWAGGKTGWFTAKLAQELGVPIAKVADVVNRYAPALSTLSGAQGALDLAQMAEPKRRDIGVLGVGPTDTTASDRAAVMRSQIHGLMAQGLSAGEATRKVYDAWASVLRVKP